MDNFGRVIGKAIGREAGGPKSEYLLVEDKSEPQYPKQIACEFYGEGNRAQLDSVQPGDFVKVEGSIRSNRSVKGRLFTSFVAYRVTKMNHLLPGSAPDVWPSKHHESRPVDVEEEDKYGTPF